MSRIWDDSPFAARSVLERGGLGVHSPAVDAHRVAVGRDTSEPLRGPSDRATEGGVVRRWGAALLCPTAREVLEGIQAESPASAYHAGD